MFFFYELGNDNVGEVTDYAKNVYASEDRLKGTRYGFEYHILKVVSPRFLLICC